MPKHKIYFISAAFIIILLGLGVIFLNIQSKQNFYIQIQGKWMASKNDYELFSGETHVVYLNSKPGSKSSKMMLIYDEEARGLLCSEIMQETQNTVCQPVTTNKKRITADDRADLVLAETYPITYSFVTVFAFYKNTLEIQGVSVMDNNCLIHNNCDYQPLSFLKKN